jgi:hypothetical protein
MMKKFLVVFAVIASFTMNQTAVAQEVNDDLIRVFKWYNSRDKEYVILADGEIQEGQLLQWLYKEKTFMFYAYKSPGADRVAVYRWTNPTTKDQVSIAEDEAKDSDMMQKGYTLKSLQFYAPIRRAENHIPVYRWYKKTLKDWVTFTENAETDKYFKLGYGFKTFQYYGVMRNEYER